MSDLLGRVERARMGEGNGVLIVGDAGVGKTALIREVCSGVADVRVLRVSGVESEAWLGFSVLAELTRPLLGLLAEIPRAQAAALEGALALGPAVAPDRFAAYAGTLSLLAAAALRSPLVVWVDDAHWVDADSAGAFSFCARRIYAEPILMVLAARERERQPMASDAYEIVTLRGLDAHASGALLTAVSGVEVADAVAGRLHAATGGNPLALTELGGLLTVTQLEGRAAIDEPVPVGAAVERVFWRQVAQQPPAVQAALVLAASSTSGSMAEIEKALAAIGGRIEDLEGAETAGLIRLGDARVEFKHPLLRAVVYRAATAGQRRDAHRALAETVSGADAPLRRAWHRASATAGVDESVASELEQAGEKLLARTGFAAAASALERAAALSEETEARAGRLLQAGRAALVAGLVQRARDAAEAAAETTADLRVEAECDHLQGVVELYAGNVNEAHRLLLAAAERVAPHDPVREVQLLTDAAVPLINAARLTEALEVAHRAYCLARRVGGGTEAPAQTILGAAMLVTGRTAEGYRLVIEGMQKEDAQPSAAPGQVLGAWFALCSAWVEDYERARAVTSALLRRCRETGALTLLAQTQAVVSELELRAGDWATALAAGREAVSVATELGHLGVAGYLTFLARVEAATGDEQSCYEHTERALELTHRSGAESGVTHARAARGLLELGRSRLESAYEELAPLPELTLRQGLAEPGVVLWQPDWIETNIRLGNRKVAEGALARLQREAARTGRVCALAAAARCRGLMAPDDGFAECFVEAFALHSQTATPFERARTELCFGERLRRAGERRKARVPLDQALRTFRRLGAAPWAERAESELTATGATHGRTTGEVDRPTQELLTAQELQVALMVAEGRSNKEAAAALFLSPKTIEFHLGHIYRKLDVHSRTQLARHLMAERETPQGTTLVAAPNRD